MLCCGWVEGMVWVIQDTWNSSSFFKLNVEASIHVYDDNNIELEEMKIEELNVKWEVTWKYPFIVVVMKEDSN